MRRRVWVLLASAALAFGQNKEPAWGSSRVPLLAADPALHDNGPVIQRDVASWGGSPAQVLYIFVGDKLVRSKFVFSTPHQDPTDFLRDYTAIAARMLTEFGSPTNERAVWEDDSLQEEKLAYLQQDRAKPSDILPSDKNVGLSIALGHLKLYAQWCGSRTQILHTLTGEDHKVTHQIEFRSTELRSLEPLESDAVLTAVPPCR